MMSIAVQPPRKPPHEDLPTELPYSVPFGADQAAVSGTAGTATELHWHNERGESGPIVAQLGDGTTATLIVYNMLKAFVTR